MRILIPIAISLVMATWVMAIAIVSVQNATPVSLKFLMFQSIQIPVGLLLAFSMGVGLIGMALLQPLWDIGSFEQSQSQWNEDAEFFVDDEDF
ncbi:LapA family protein [Chrysosporum bergii ANA360D]|jgi:hypothetical protein|uniref:LapA family protein n=1 Tax=Chrysosporum bergii ANA360D TaxID=617107 RepID=A0AA43GQJ5_9CYAN|nr:LapA family protein [Chrysosporum bergii]MDH6059918.1 LapA family protein [Chrysosporum bergii ANA360D]